MLTHAVERFFCRIRTCALIILPTILVVPALFPVPRSRISVSDGKSSFSER